MRTYALSAVTTCAGPTCSALRSTRTTWSGQPTDHDFAAIRVHARDGAEADVSVRRDYTPDPSLFLKPLSAPAPPEKEKCKEFPGGSTDCEIDATSGTPTGRVKTKVDETNPCTKPCVEKHEAVHVKQMQKLCASLRDCYVDADKGRRPQSDCFRLAMGSSAKNECEAYNVSVPCVAERLRSAPECRSPQSQRYGAEKLKSEQCWRDHYCGAAT